MGLAAQSKLTAHQADRKASSLRKLSLAHFVSHTEPLQASSAMKTGAVHSETGKAQQCHLLVIINVFRMSALLIV